MRGVLSFILLTWLLTPALLVPSPEAEESGNEQRWNAEMERFRKLEADERDGKNQARAIDATLSGAMIKLENGQSQEALDEISEGIRTDSDSVLLHLNFGIAQSRLGRHGDAVKTFQTMIDEGLGDSFLVDLNLSREYEALGDKPKSQRHRLNYLRKYDASLKKAR